MMLARRAAFIVLTLACACKKEPPPAIEPDKPTPAPSASASTSNAPEPPQIVGDCLAPKFRGGELENAWVDGGNIVYCVKAPDFAAGTSERACFTVDVGSGITHAASNTLVAVKEPPAKVAALASSSTGGTATFDLKGGLRTPKGAQVTLVDKTSKATKRAPLDYDEHVAFDGWIGDGVVLRTWVDEGPGCMRVLYEPRKAWPIVLGSAGIDLGSCYGTEGLVFDTKSGKKAFIDGSGADLQVVDPATLVVTDVDPHRETGGPGEFSVFTPSSLPDQVVVLFHAPVMGDLVRYDLGKEGIAGESTARACETGDAGADAR